MNFWDVLRANLGKYVSQNGLSELGELAKQLADSFPNPVIFRAFGRREAHERFRFHEVDLALEEPVDLVGDSPNPTAAR